jgi:hypothetical protein
VFRVLGLQGLSAKVRFGDEVLERGDRFMLSETAQTRVAAMYAELSGAEPCDFVEENERELAEAV